MDAGEADRLARLEREMAILRVEFAKLREHVGGPHAAEAPPPRPAPPPRSPSQDAPFTAAPKPASAPFVARPPRHGPSVEELIGRYGTMAVATITILTGVGILLNYLIQKKLLGPETRVVLGYLVALGFAIGGVRVRMRGTREFGNVLLAIALAVTHLVCWSAGPLLHVLPSSIALAIGFLASVVLAEFALRHEEQALCAIGFGGAAIAPFVTSDGSNNVIALAIYGLIVVALSAGALRDRAWQSAIGVTMGSVAVYVVALASARPPHTAWPGIVSRLGILFPMAALVAFIPLAHARHRRNLIRFATGAVAVGGMMHDTHMEGDLWALALMVAALVVGIGALDMFRLDAVERDDKAGVDPLAVKRNAFLDALALPLGLFIAAVVASPGPHSSQSATVGAVWSVLAIVMTVRNRAESEGEMYATTASLTALWVVPAAIPESDPLARVLGAIAVGIVLMLLAQRLGRKPFAGGGLASLAIASLWAISELEKRPAFAYAPFATWASITTIAVIGGWLVAHRITRQPAFLPTLDDTDRKTVDMVVVTGCAATAFLWGRSELGGAWNVTASTALLIVYYAATGTLLIWLGRERRVKPWRVLGLLLTLLAAGKALIEAFEVPNVAVRIVIFFAVSAFLIAVGYWYRSGADEVLSPLPSAP